MHRTENYGDPAQGLRWLVPRDVQPGNGSRHGFRLAYGRDRRDGAEAAVKILYRKELAEAEDRQAKAAELAQEYRDEFASPYVSAGNFYITDVIEPQDTRWMVALALRKILDKRELRPAKKHGNIPM